MRPVSLLLILAFSCPALTIIPDPEGEQRHAALVRHNEACIRQLEAVTNRESADAAAKAIASRKQQHHSETFDYTAEHARLQKLSNRLCDKYFYGSTALAKTLGYPVNDALLPSPVTPELITRMEADAQQHISQREDISGGCGFTQERAWIIDIDDTRQSQMTASALVFEVVGGQVYRCIHRMELTETRRYMVFTLTLIRDGKKYIVEQWCDTTATGKVYSPARRSRAREKINEKANELYAALLSIRDEETAEDSGEDVLELCEDIDELDRICEADETVLNHLLNAFDMPAQERLTSHLNELRASLREYDDDLRTALDRNLYLAVPH